MITVASKIHNQVVAVNSLSGMNSCVEEASQMWRFFQSSVLSIILTIMTFTSPVAFSFAESIGKDSGILSGKCAYCVFEDIKITARDGYSSRLTLSAPVNKSSIIEATKRLLTTKRSGPGHTLKFLTVKGFDHNGKVSKELPLAPLNACIHARNQHCESLVEFEYLIAKSRVVVVSLETKMKPGQYPGNNYMRTMATPSSFFGPDFEIRLSSDVKLYVEGDIKASNTPNKWSYSDINEGYIAISTIPNWKSLSIEYQKAERQSIQNSDDLLAKSFVANQRPEKALSASWLWLRKNMKYFDRNSIFDTGNAPLPIGQIMASGKGDCKDFAAMLVALLKVQGIDAYSVLVDRDKNPKFDSNIPTHRLDHVLVYVPSLGRYVDPTFAPSKPLPTGGRTSYSFALDTRTGNHFPLSEVQTD